MELDAKDKQQLLTIANDTLEAVVSGQAKPELAASDYSSSLLADGASFVTLKKDGQLRGCIGTLVARQPLYLDVQENAINSAFNDYRFAKVQQQELASIEISISVLTPPVALDFVDEENCLAQIRAGVDGVIIRDHGHSGTFLPVVWEELPDKHLFWQHLKNKANLPSNHWSDTVEVFVYQSILIKK